MGPTSSGAMDHRNVSHVAALTAPRPLLRLISTLVAAYASRRPHADGLLMGCHRMRHVSVIHGSRSANAVSHRSPRFSPGIKQVGKPREQARPTNANGHASRNPGAPCRPCVRRPSRRSPATPPESATVPAAPAPPESEGTSHRDSTFVEFGEGVRPGRSTCNRGDPPCKAMRSATKWLGFNSRCKLKHQPLDLRGAKGPDSRLSKKRIHRMGRRASKDLFIVHTKTTVVDSLVADSLARFLLPASFTIWGYDDWNWLEPRDDPRSWQDELMSQSYVDDPLSPYQDSPPRRRSKPDARALDTILSRTRAVLFLYPSTGILTPGMKDELWSLRRRPHRRTSEAPAPTFVWSMFSNQEREPLPIAGQVWRTVVRVHADEDTPAAACIATIAAAIAGSLLEQRTEYVQQLGENNRGYLSLLYCSPEEELRRAREIHDVVMKHATSTPHDAVTEHAQKLDTLLRSCTLADIDDR